MVGLAISGYALIALLGLVLVTKYKSSYEPGLDSWIYMAWPVTTVVLFLVFVNWLRGREP